MAGKTKLTKHVVSSALAKIGNVSKTAELLGVSRYTLHRWMRRWEIESPAHKADVATPEILTESSSNSVLKLCELHGLLVAGPLTYRLVNVDAFTGRCVGDVGHKRRH